MSRPTGRVLSLLEPLQSGGTQTMAELAERIGVDPRTVRPYVGQCVASVEETASAAGADPATERRLLATAAETHVTNLDGQNS